MNQVNLPEGDLQQITMILLGTQRKWKSHRAVFKWLSKKQYQNYYSGQSQQERAAWWTNQNSLQLHAFAQSAETIAHTGCNWFWFSVLLVGWKNSSRFLRQSLSVNQFQSRNYFQQSFENCSASTFQVSKYARSQPRSQWVGACNSTTFPSRHVHRPTCF